MKKIPLEQLLRESRTEDYPEQYRYVRSRIEQQKLIPVKSSQLNGKKPALHLYYWLAEDAPDYGQETEELKFGMVPAISTDYYLRHPDVYRIEAKWVRLLNRFFLEQRERKAKGLGEPDYVSLNERSFQIWGREKFLQREQGKTILTHCGVSVEQLRVYGTTEPLAYYSCSRKVPQTVLIVENKDTFYSMRRYLGGMESGSGFCGKGTGDGMSGRETAQREEGFSDGEPGAIFGQEIGTVIYGAGKGIFRSFEDFGLCVEPHINDSRNQILYFGDLDYEGIGIYEHLSALFGSGAQICPFVQAYEKMLEKAARCGQDFLPETSGKQNRNLSGVFFQCFAEDTEKQMRQILEAGKYIPQEIINITDFR